MQRFNMIVESSALQLLTLVSMFAPYTTQTAVITPLSYTARLGSVGTFHCAATENHFISWYINNVPSTTPEVQNRRITATGETPINVTWNQSILTVYASKENDGLTIRCVAIVLGGRDGFSPTAIFHVQRQPSPPTNLTLEVSEDHRYLMLQWKPPPGLNDSSAYHNITYTVYVNISCTGMEFSSNTTMREYTMENPCSDVLFRVAAWDDIGEGNGTTLLYRHNSTEAKSAVVLVSVTFAASGTPNVQLIFKIKDICFLRRLQGSSQLFIVEMWSNCSGSTRHQGPLTLQPTIVNSTVILVIPHLLPNCHITARVHNQEVFNSPSNFTFGTYGVQGAEITEDNLYNSICITCTFARGTSAQGCYISLLWNHDSVTTNTTGLGIEREGDSLNATGCIEDLEGGLYHVVVYDVVADGTVDWQSRALFLTAALNWTSPSSEPDQLNKTYSFSDAPSTPGINATLYKVSHPDSPVSALAGGAGGGALLLVVTALILLCILIMRKAHSTTDSSQNINESNHNGSETIEMKNNIVYGQLQQQQIVRNPAYNWWKPRSCKH